MAADGRWVGREEALERLGVKTQTLYAYVSRGRIAARPDPGDPRRSLYALADIGRLLGETVPEDSPRPPPQGAASRGEADVQTSLSVIAGSLLFYRGQDVARLSETATLEDVVRLLWGLPSDPFASLRPRVDGVMGGSVRARTFAALARRAEEDRPALDRSADDLRAEAASVLNEVIDAAAGPGPRLFLHQRLARGWKAFERDAHLVRRALVLAADGPPTPPILATRAAIAGGAPLAGGALAGLSTFSGAHIKREALEVSEWVIDARRDPDRLNGPDLPGFGDPAWPDGDPRAAALLEAAELGPDLKRIVVMGSEATGRQPTFALALALVARRLDLPRTGASDLLLLGRLAGLMGHALDQAIDGSPIRARLRYVGPEPGAR